MKDIYTTKPIVMRSEEHIVQNALGGRKTSADLIDKTTNDTFGSTIDAELTSSFHLIRVLLDGKSGEGASAPPLRNGKGSDGKNYRLLAGGEAELAYANVRFDEKDGWVTVTGQAPNMRELRRCLDRKLKLYGVSLEQAEAHAKASEHPAPLLSFNFSFGPTAWRAVVKIACNLLAATHRELFLTEPFDPVRKFVLEDGNTWDFVAINTSPVAAGTTEAYGQLDHVVVVRGVAGKVHGLVSFYGHVQFTVYLGDIPADLTFCTAYRVNQVTARDRFDHPEDVCIPLPEFVPLSEGLQRAAVDALEAALGRSHDLARGVERERAAAKTIETQVNGMLAAADGQPLTQEQIEKCADELAERYARLFFPASGAVQGEEGPV